MKNKNNIKNKAKKAKDDISFLFGKNTKGKQNKPNIFVITLFLLVGWLLIGTLLFSGSGQKVPFSQITGEIDGGNIEKVEFSDNSIKAYPKDGSDVLQADLPTGTDFLSYMQDNNLVEKVETLEAIRPFDFVNSIGLLVNIAFFALLAFFVFMMLKQRGGAGDIFNFGKSKAKLFVKNGKKNTTFNDVAVSEEIKEEMYELVDFLKNPKKYTKVGARIPKGVLLVGPAGVGKTLIARAIAGEAGVPFFSAAGSEFMEMLVGVGSARVRDMFKNAKASSPALIFIDEIDAIGRQRGMGIGGGHDEREQTLNQILVEMDGFDKNVNVIVLAATNRPDMLDPALVRPGRFDRKISLQLPTLENREQIIKIHAQGKPLENGVKLKQIAQRTVGFSGADIENMLNEAAILAARKNKQKISYNDISEAATKVKLGPERRKLQDDEDKKHTAYHEAGHAIVAHYLPKVDPVRRVSIVARTMSLGHTDITGEKEEFNYTTQKLTQMIAMMLGGRVAEELFFNEFGTGASNDIERATDFARRMVTEWGMSKLGPINYSRSEDRLWIAKQLGTHIDYSEKTAEKIDSEVEKIMLNAKQLATKTVSKHKKELEEVVKALLKKETLEQDEFEKIVGKKNEK